jgi:hypothetical protein
MGNGIRWQHGSEELPVTVLFDSVASRNNFFARKSWIRGPWLSARKRKDTENTETFTLVRDDATPTFKAPQKYTLHHSKSICGQKKKRSYARLTEHIVILKYPTVRCLFLI